jgi:hypothetical protein
MDFRAQGIGTWIPQAVVFKELLYREMVVVVQE